MHLDLHNPHHHYKRSHSHNCGTAGKSTNWQRYPWKGYPAARPLRFLPSGCSGPEPAGWHPSSQLHAHEAVERFVQVPVLCKKMVAWSACNRGVKNCPAQHVNCDHSRAPSLSVLMQQLFSLWILRCGPCQCLLYIIELHYFLLALSLILWFPYFCRYHFIYFLFVFFWILFDTGTDLFYHSSTSVCSLWLSHLSVAMDDIYESVCTHVQLWHTMYLMYSVNYGKIICELWQN